MRGLFACIAALTLCGCEPSLWSHATPTPKPVEPYTGPMRELTALEKKAIAEKVSDQLKDPASAQFKWAKARANSPTGTIPYCALVNARNSFGGYVGYKAFAVNLTSPRGAKPVVDFIGWMEPWWPIWRNRTWRGCVPAPVSVRRSLHNQDTEAPEFRLQQSGNRRKCLLLNKRNLIRSNLSLLFGPCELWDQSRSHPSRQRNCAWTRSGQAEYGPIPPCL